MLEGGPCSGCAAAAAARSAQAALWPAFQACLLHSVEQKRATRQQEQRREGRAASLAPASAQHATLAHGRAASCRCSALPAPSAAAACRGARWCGHMWVDWPELQLGAALPEWSCPPGDPLFMPASLSAYPSSAAPGRGSLAAHAPLMANLQPLLWPRSRLAHKSLLQASAALQATPPDAGFTGIAQPQQRGQDVWQAAAAAGRGGAGCARLLWQRACCRFCGRAELQQQSPRTPAAKWEAKRQPAICL